MTPNKRTISSRLTAYATAAGALASAGTAQAVVTVYDNGGSGWSIATGQFLTFDIAGSTNVGTIGTFGPPNINGFGIINYQVGTYTSRAVLGFSASATGGTKNQVELNRLSYGAPIGPPMSPNSYALLTASGSGPFGWSTTGPSSTGYVGLYFSAGGTVNAGWAEVTLDTAGPSQTVTLHRYAVENSPVTTILAGSTVSIPEVSSLTMASLILGAAGVFVLRRRKSN